MGKRRSFDKRDIDYIFFCHNDYYLTYITDDLIEIFTIANI